jgi:hypothetical protein
MSRSASTSFWSRFGLSAEDALQCIRAVQNAYHGYEVGEFEEQGYCSFTLLVTLQHDIPTFGEDGLLVMNTVDHDRREEESLIVQIRPAQHALDINIANAARETYASLAPTIRDLNLDLPEKLYAYEIQKMPGIPLSRLMPRIQELDPATQVKQRRLVKSFATLIAHSWPLSSTLSPKIRATRADSPMDFTPNWQSQCRGKIGSSIISRLRKLCNNLPDSHLRGRAEATLARVQAMDDYVVVLNHGDLIPSNILVDEDTWEITGLVDWAEAEYLPFGACLYGLENMLGYVSQAPTASAPLAEESRTGISPAFVYYDSAPGLRELFWTRLLEAVPEIKLEQDDVKTMRDVGVLLWYGYAWDDGAIDRVVNEKEDAVEVACLRAFLGVE